MDINRFDAERVFMPASDPFSKFRLPRGWRACNFIGPFMRRDYGH